MALGKDGERCGKENKTAGYIVPFNDIDIIYGYGGECR